MSMDLVYVQLSKLKPSRRNARTHSKTQIKQIVASIETFGFTNPLLIDEENALIAGHGRLEAAKEIGLKELPAIRLTHLSDPEKRALMLADNKIALNAGWDLDLLASELADLSEMQLDFALEATGFEIPEIDLIIGATPDKAEAPETLEVPDPNTSAVTQPGDLWKLGKHRILCGNARNPEDYTVIMEGEHASMVFTDPPYNVSVSGHVCGLGKTQHREFAEASGEMSSKEFQSFLTEVLQNAYDASAAESIAFICMDWRHIPELHAAGLSVFDDWLNLCVWAKTNGGMGSLYRSQHELVFVFRKGKRHRNNVALGRFGRNRTNLWTYAGVNTFRKGRMEELTAHPTAKPVAMVQDAILDVSKKGDIVLDPFLGGGATLIAAERSRRRCYALEIDPIYVDACLRRWRDETGKDPVRVSDGRTLLEITKSKTVNVEMEYSK